MLFCSAFPVRRWWWGWLVEVEPGSRASPLLYCSASGGRVVSCRVGRRSGEAAVLVKWWSGVEEEAHLVEGGGGLGTWATPTHACCCWNRVERQDGGARPESASLSRLQRLKTKKHYKRSTFKTTPILDYYYLVEEIACITRGSPTTTFGNKKACIALPWKKNRSQVR